MIVISQTGWILHKFDILKFVVKLKSASQLFVSHYTTNNCVSLIRGGQHYFDHLLQLIASAKNTLHLQTYIYEEDETGELVSDALIEAAQRGVKVFLLVDGYASQALSRAFISKLSAGGIKFRYFEPLFKSRRFYLGRRLHHKVVVADIQRALVGGINVANHYNDFPGQPAWLDFALCVEGEVVKDLLVQCQKTWNGFQPLKKIPVLRGVPVFNIPANSRSRVRMRRNDWVRRKYDISLSYLELFSTAEKDIVLVSSYFLPGRLFRRGIRQARERGVAISVIVAGVSDVLMSKMAERYMYEWLLSKGVRIFEYNRVVLHGKLAICDDRWMTLGSFNVNDISTYASVELNLDVEDSNFVGEVRQYLKNEVFPYCTEISLDYMTTHSSVFTRALEWVAFLSFRVIFYFFTFYFQRIGR